MGYCTYGGKPVPINDQAGCIGGGGNWVDDIAPIQRGGVNIMHPYSQANTDQLTALSNVTGAGTLGKVVPRIGAGLPGRFTGQPNTVQQVQKAAQPIQGPAQQKLTDIGKIGATTPTKLQRLDNAVYKAGQYVGNNPIKATAAATGVGVPAYNIFNSGEPVADKQVVQNNTPVNQQSPILTKEQIKQKNVALMNAKNAGDTTAVNEILAGKTGKTNKINANGLLAPMPVIPRPEGTQGPLSETGSFNPSNKLGGGQVQNMGKEGKIPTSIWDKMQTKGFWLDGVEGGSGKWDNRLFRLGEMMTHMGTPLSKQGDSPAKRWSTANTAANTLKATNAKASGLADDNATKADQARWTNMVKAQQSNLKDKYMQDRGGFLGMFKMSVSDQNAAAVTAAQDEMNIKYEMIGLQIEPTTANYIKFIELKAKGQI